MSLLSVNNRFVVEPYLSDRAIKMTNTTGFSMIQQKVAVKGLKTLIDGSISGTNFFQFIPAGSTVYIREEYLHTAPWAKNLMEADGVKGKFMIVDVQYVEFVDIEVK